MWVPPRDASTAPQPEDPTPAEPGAPALQRPARRKAALLAKIRTLQAIANQLNAEGNGRRPHRQLVG